METGHRAAGAYRAVPPPVARLEVLCLGIEGTPRLWRVVEADAAEPVRLSFALKVIQQGMDSTAVFGRIEDANAKAHAVLAEASIRLHGYTAETASKLAEI